MKIRTKRLNSGDESEARTLFALMAAVFTEDSGQLSEGYLSQLLDRDEFWVIAAFSGDRIIGGITAYSLPMTRTETPEIFIYDIAVHGDYQRKGAGRRLVEVLRKEASARGIDCVFVAADDEDIHALDFYRSLGGTPSPVTIFTFDADGG